MEVENIRKSFWRLKEGEKGKNFDKKVNSLTRYKIGSTRVDSVESSSLWYLFFLFTLFFFANPIPSSPLGLWPRFARKTNYSCMTSKIRKISIVFWTFLLPKFLNLQTPTLNPPILNQQNLWSDWRLCEFFMVGDVENVFDVV